MTYSLGCDTIPAGVFFAEDEPLTPEQAAALRHVERIGQQLAEEQPEIVAELAHDVSLRYGDIAALLIPAEVEQYPEVAEKAIGLAVRLLIPKDELETLTHNRRSLRLKERAQSVGGVAYSAHQRAAASKSWENSNSDRAARIDAMLANRGVVAWSAPEREVLAELIHDLDFQHQDGPQTGRPNYALIALELNIRFHNCEGIRYPNSVRTMRNKLFKK